MIRLTLLLIAAIAITMIVAGREPERTTEAEAATPPVGVARAGTAPTALPDNRLALDDEAGAIARALAATEAAEEEPEPQKASLETTSAAPPPAPEEDGPVWYVTGSRVNLREGPSTSTAVVGQVREGQRVEVLDGTPDGWMRIRVIESGLTAYIFGRFLSERPAG